MKNGYIRRITDEEIKSLALEIAGTNVATTYIYCPPDPKKVLGIKLPFLVIIIKNMKKYFTFEITVKKSPCEYVIIKQGFQFSFSNKRFPILFCKPLHKHKNLFIPRLNKNSHFFQQIQRFCAISFLNKTLYFLF